MSLHRGWRRRVAFTLVLVSVAAVHCDSHSLRYYYIGVSGTGSGLPAFSKLGYVDDKMIEKYNSDTDENVPVAPWMKTNLSPDVWYKKTLTSKANKAFFRHEVKIVTARFNHTQGLHYVQVLHSCELNDDGTTLSYEKYTYDGEEFMVLDVKTGTFVATMAQAQIITQRWNSPDVREGESVKNFLTNECIVRLKRYIEYGREDLERRVRPQVKVTGREWGEVTKLHCLVYGFHPRAVDVKWMKNGEDDVPTYETTHILPNPDGTYQIRVSVDVIPKEGDTYSCYVDHSSLEEPLLVTWEPKRDVHLAWIASLVVIIVLASVITGVVIYKRNRENYRAASTSDIPCHTISPDSS